MKRFLFIFSILSSVLFCTYAQDSAITNRYEQANALYTAGEYIQAAHLYEQVIKEEGVAPEVYYNLGNSYYKANEIGKSILNYERALRLKPTYEDALYNLELANAKVIDNISQEEPFFIKKGLEQLIILLSSNQWLFISWGLFILCIIGLLLFIFGSSRGLRKTSFTLTIIMLIISLVSLGFSISRKKQITDHNNAIVMNSVVTVKSSPDRSGTDLFELHEGTKVKIKSTLGGWIEIIIGDGRIGWLQEETIEKI